MPKVFVSWYDGQNHSAANEFFTRLKQQDFDVQHSPHSPHSGTYDKRWATWYKTGLPNAVDWADNFVAVITSACDASSWMMQEYQIACSSFIRIGRPVLYYIRFDAAKHFVKYPQEYLSRSIQLSSIPEEAIQTLIKSRS